MHETDRHSETETVVPYNHLTSKTKPLDTISQIRRRAEDPEAFGATSAIRIYRFFKLRVSWTQRIQGWFSRH